MYIEQLMAPRDRYYRLLEALRIDENEVLTDNREVCLGGRMTIYHDSYAKMKHKREITTVITDFEVISIYGQEPSEYDQQLYQNVMKNIFNRFGYEEKLRAYKRKKNRKKPIGDTESDDEASI